jgi:hypothetical protein
VEEDLVLEDIICVLSSLIDQDLIVANISYSQRQLVMRPAKSGGGFPRLKDVVPRKVVTATQKVKTGAQAHARESEV